jgi:hypothetical protein
MTSEATQAVKPIEKPTNWKLIISTWGAYVCVVLGIAVAIPPVVILYHEKVDRFTLSNFSSLGSYWQGSVASLFSLGAFLLIYATFLAQQKQIAQQDQELEDQKHQFQLQQESIKRQVFESSFFQLLNLHRELQSQLQTIRIEISDRGIGVKQIPVHGKDCFQVFRDKMQEQYKNNRAAARLHTDEFPSDKAQVPSENAQALIAYEQVYRAEQQQLAHYFRNLYHLFKFAATSDMPNKRRYTSLIRAQLSAYELAVLFYNCITPHGKNFHPLIEEFGLLEHLDRELLLNPSHAENEEFYAKSAYK